MRNSSYRVGGEQSSGNDSAKGWFIDPSPHVYINKRETGFSGCANQLSGILTTSGVQFHGAYWNRIKKPSHGDERAHKNITFAINWPCLRKKLVNCYRISYDHHWSIGCQRVQVLWSDRFKMSYSLRLFLAESLEGSCRLGKFTWVSFLEHAPARIIFKKIWKISN